MRIPALLTATLCLSLLSGCGQADEVSCPVPQLQSASGDLKEGPDDIKAMSDRFTGDFSENAISAAIASLKLKYPEAGNDAIANYLVAAYCPDAKALAADRQAQQAKLDAFEAAVHTVMGD